MKKFLKRLSQPKYKSEKSSESHVVPSARKSDACYEVKEKDLPRLHKAVWQGDLEAVKRLVMKEPMVPDKESRTPLHLACAKGNIEIIQCLLEYNAKVNLLDQNFQTPLMKAIQGGHSECIDLLLNYRADLTVRDEDGNAPLHLAVKYGHRDIAELFLRAGVGINSHNSQGMTPLHMAVENQNVVMVNFLLSEGAEIDCITNTKKSALMISCEKGDAEIADLLISCGADFELRDCHEHTAEDIAKLNGHDECYQLLHSLRDSVGSVGRGSSSSPQRPLRSNFPNESSSSYHEREVNQGPRQTTSAKSKKPEFQTVDRKPWRLSDVLGEDTGDDVVDIETDLNSPIPAEDSHGLKSGVKPGSRGSHGDQDQQTAVCSVEDASESANQPKLCEEDNGCEEVEEGATETSRPRLVPRNSVTENRVVSRSGSVEGVTGPPDAVKSSISSPTSSASKKNTQSWEVEREYTRNMTVESTDLHATALKAPVSSLKPETDDEEDSWASDDSENNETKKRCEAVAKALAQKRLAQTIESSSEKEKPSGKKVPEYQTDSDCDKSDWDSNNSAKGRQHATMDTHSAFARVRQQMRFSLGLDQSEEEEEEKQQEEKPGVKDIIVHSSPRLASKTALERPASNQSPWDSSDSEIASGKMNVVSPRPPNAGSVWLKSSPGFQQAEQTKLPLPENKPRPPTPEVDDRWDSSSTSDGDEIPMLGDEVTSEQDDVNSKPSVKVPSPTAAKSDVIGVSTADKPVTNLMQAIDYEDDEEMAPYIESSSKRDVHAMSVQMTVSRTLPTCLYRSQGYESDEAGAGLSPIEERTEDCFSFASNSSHSKKEENPHQSVCLSPGTPLSAEPLYVNAEWLKQFSEGDSTGTGIANLPSESRSLKITQTVVTDTDVKQNKTSGFETQNTESVPVLQSSPASSNEHTLTQKTVRPSSRPSSVERLRQMLHSKVPENLSRVSASLTSNTNHSSIHDAAPNGLTHQEPNVEETSSVVCFEEKLVQALRALEREHRARQKVEAELDKARTRLAEAVLKAEASTSEESTSVPKDVSEITAECNLLRMKLNEEIDHRQSLETVYENLKKQLIAKEEELYRSRSQCVDLEMEVSQAKIRLKSARADYERLKKQLRAEVHPPDEGEDSSKIVSRDFARAPLVFPVEAPSVARRNYVPDGGPTPTNEAAVQATNNTSVALPEVKLHINNLRELITAEKSRLKYQTDEMHDQLQELHSLFKNLAEKLVRCSVDDSSADRSKLLEIEIEHLHETQLHLERVANEKLRKYAQQIEDQANRLGSLSQIDADYAKLQSENKTTKEGLEFYKDKCNLLEGKLAESENVIESEQRQLEKLESELREVLREQSQKEEEISHLKNREKFLFSWLTCMRNNLSAIDIAAATVHTNLSQILKPASTQGQAVSPRTFSPAEWSQVEELLRVLLSAQEAANRHLDEIKSAGVLDCAADTEECFLAKKKALLKTADLPPSETDSALVVEQFLIERLLLRTRAEQEAVLLATERQAELLRVKAELAKLSKMKENMHQNRSSQTTANVPVVPPMTASAGDEAGVSATAQEPCPQWQSECMGPQAPIGSFENVFARLKNPATCTNANLELDGCLMFSGKEVEPLQFLQTDNQLSAYRTSNACKVDGATNHNRNPQDPKVLIATVTKAHNELQGQNAALQNQLKQAKTSRTVDRRSSVPIFRSCYCPKNTENEHERLKQRVTELEQERGRILTEKQVLEENARTEHKLASKLIQHMDLLSNRPMRQRASGSTTMTPARKQSYRHTSTNSVRQKSESLSSSSELSSDEVKRTPMQKPARHRYRKNSGGRAYSRRRDHQNASPRPDDKYRYEPVTSGHSDVDSDESSVDTPKVDHDIKRSRRPLVERKPYPPCSNLNPNLVLDRYPTRDIMRNFGNVFLPQNGLSVASTASTTNILLQKAKLSLQAVEKDLSSLGPPPDVNSNEYLQYLRKKYMF